MKLFSLQILCVLILIKPLTAAAQEGTWKMLTTKNAAPNRSECGLAAANGKLYLIGGDTGEPMAVESFDPKTLMWAKLAAAPVMMHHFQAVSLNNKIYILEAFYEGGFPNQEPMPNVYVYDIKNNSWQKGGGLPAARRRAGAGAVVYQGKLYLVAGIQHGHSSGTTNMFDMYDPATQTWSALPDAPHIRDHCSAAIVKDKLYVVGGRNTSYRDPDNKVTFFSQTVLDVDCYDFETGTWSTLQARLPLGSGGGAVVNLHNVLYYIGGERETNTERNAPRKNTYFLDPASQNNWKETDSLHYSRNGMAAAVLNDKIYVAGGSGGGFGGPPPMPPKDSSNHSSMPVNPPPLQNHQNKNDVIKLEIFSLQ